MANYYPSREWLARDLAPEAASRLGHRDLLRDYPGRSDLYEARSRALAEHYVTNYRDPVMNDHLELHPDPEFSKRVDEAHKHNRVRRYGTRAP